jgi:hypothetical protein
MFSGLNRQFGSLLIPLIQPSWFLLPIRQIGSTRCCTEEQRTTDLRC